MWSQKPEQKPLDASIQIPVASADRKRLQALAVALDKKEGALARDILLSSLDSCSPTQASALMADYLDLSVDGSPLTLWLGTEEVPQILQVGRLDDDGHYLPPDGQDDQDWADFAADACEELARQIEAAAEFWSDYPAAVLRFAHRNKSEEWCDVVVEMAERDCVCSYACSYEQACALAAGVAAGGVLREAWYCLSPAIDDGEHMARWGELSARQRAEISDAVGSLGLGEILKPL